MGMETIIYPVLFEKVALVDQTNVPWKCTEWDWDIITAPTWGPENLPVIDRRSSAFYDAFLNPYRCFDIKADTWTLRIAYDSR